MSVSPKNKGWREEFAKFFENPSREGLRDFLKNHAGELNGYDFKGEWPTFPKVARHILGLANSGGGCLVIGVDEKTDKTFEPVGVDQLLDKADIQKGIQKFIPPQLKYEVLDFAYTDSEYPKLVGKKFQVLLVEDLPEYIPFVAISNGEGIRGAAIYTRRGTNSEEANYEELQGMFNRRLGTGYSSEIEFDIDKQLAELNSLYNRISPYYNPAEAEMFYYLDYHANPKYPDEDFDEFVRRMIDQKKEIIERVILRK